MKKMFVLCLTVGLLLAVAAPALAAGYLSDAEIQAMVVPNDPHGGYANTTNRCKACHAVHLATGSFRILRANTAGDECAYCHGPSGIIASVPRVEANTAEGHTMNASQNQVAPDDVDGSAYNPGPPGLRCGSCHSVHDNGSVTLLGETSSHLLKKNPDGAGSDFTGADDESKWCADCHDANYGSHKVGTDKDGNTKLVGGAQKYGHDCDTGGMDMQAPPNATWPVVDPDVDPNDGPTCQQCHANTGFPHDSKGTAHDMLKDSSFGSGNQLDDVCNDCHDTTKLP